MKSFLTTRFIAVAALATAALGAASVAQAGGSSVYLSIGVPFQPAYVERAPVYVQPRPVYVQPRPVYVQPRPVIVSAPAYGWYDNDRGHGHGWKHAGQHQRQWERRHHDEDRHGGHDRGRH